MTDRRLGRADIRQLLVEGDVHPSKALGQNFVTDPNTVDRIARLARVGENDHVVEVGAGLGSLTLALASTGAKVVAIEFDQRLVEVLLQVVPSTVRVVAGDALHLDFDALMSEVAPNERWTLVANLPYNIATPLVLRILEQVASIDRLLVMVQREVGERFSATPGGKDYGQVSVRVAYFASARVVGRVSPEVFFPRPKVDSVLVEILRKSQPPVEVDYGALVTAVRAGFAGRRKMLRRSLAGLVAPEAFARAAVESSERAEDLDVVAWGKLAACQIAIESSRLPS